MTDGGAARRGVAVRAARRDDLAAVVALMRTCDVAEFGRPDTDDADVLAEWDAFGFSLDDDTLVATEPLAPADDATATAVGEMEEAGGVTVARERIVGYAQTFERYCQVTVHPERNGLGIGTRLRRFTEARALEQAGAEVKIWQAPRRSNTTAHRLLEAAGYTRGHHYAQMSVTLDARPAPPSWPEGVTVRPFVPGRDEAACHALQNLAWSQYETYEPITYERWTDMTREPDFDPSLWFLAEEGDQVVGMCLCRKYEDIAWVASLGVHPDCRGRGLGEALLRHAFAGLHARGVRFVELSVSSRTTQSAWRLYDSVGMRDAGGWVAYEKVLGPAS